MTVIAAAITMTVSSTPGSLAASGAERGTRSTGQARRKKKVEKKLNHDMSPCLMY